MNLLIFQQFILFIILVSCQAPNGSPSGSEGHRIAEFEMQIKQISLGFDHACILFIDGNFNCFGRNDFEQLGRMDIREMPLVKLPHVKSIGMKEEVISLATGHKSTCILLKSGKVKCFGLNTEGQLGKGSSERFSLDETLFKDGWEVPLREKAIKIHGRSKTYCANFSSGKAQCWGNNSDGLVGNGSGKNETLKEPDKAEYVLIPKKIIFTSVGSSVMCSLGLSGKIYCIGENGEGQAGQGTNTPIGLVKEDFENLKSVNLKSKVIQVSSGGSHVCVLFKGFFEAKCWGHGAYGQLGYGNKNNIGDEKGEIEKVPTLIWDLEIKAIDASYGGHTCVLFESGRVKCFGRNNFKQLGYLREDNVGDDEGELEDLDFVNLDEPVTHIATGFDTTCAVMENKRVNCWGKPLISETAN